MRTLVRRLRQLEERLAPVIDPGRSETANLLRERRRRRLEASGQPFEETPRTPMLASGRCMSVSETLRCLRKERIAAVIRAKEESDSDAENR